MSNIVYSYYCLDILHRGHLRDLKKSKKLAGEKGILIVGILSDEAVMEKKPMPIIPFDERFEVASSLKYVDKVVVQDSYSPLKNLKLYKPDILMESTDHPELSINELENFMRTIGGRVVINPYYKKQSSSRIKQLIKDRV